MWPQIGLVFETLLSMGRTRTNLKEVRGQCPAENQEALQLFDDLDRLLVLQTGEVVYAYLTHDHLSTEEENAVTATLLKIHTDMTAISQRLHILRPNVSVDIPDSFREGLKDIGLDPEKDP